MKFSYTLHKNQLRWIRLELRLEAIKILKEIIDGKLLEIGFGNDFLDLISTLILPLAPTYSSAGTILASF